MQSDLEEGEIPDFEYLPSASGRKRMLLGSHRRQSWARLNAHDRNKKEGRRYASPPSEGEYISEEEELVRRDRVSHKDVCKKHLMGKSSKNLHSAQPTYGSVEDIMTKIGESLGRHSNYYYKGRRSKESRYLFTINDSRDINTVLRETSPIVKRIGYNYCYNKRRYSEPNSESANNIREKYGKIKYKKLFDAKRSGKDVARKRKREYNKVDEGSKNKTDKPKKLRFLEDKEKGTRQHRREKKHGLETRLFKEIPLPQDQEPEEQNVKELPNSNDSNCLLDDTKDSPPDTVAESNFVGSPNTAVLNGDSAIKISTDNSEHLNDEDEEDDDIELIKLRLLALTSNKKKNQSSTNNCSDKEKNLDVCIKENAINDSKSELIDDEKTVENPSGNDETVKERRCDNEIDRYELFLRAEALKTALLKKHQRILKKRRSVSAISGKKRIMGSENSNENKLAKRNEMDLDLDIISDEELFEKIQEADFDPQLEVTENYKRPKVNDTSMVDSECNKEIKTVDTHKEDGLHSENVVAPVNTDHSSEQSSFPAKSVAPEPNNALNNAEINLKNTSTGHVLGKKKAKRVKPKQTMKPIDLSETSIKETVASEKNNCQETKSQNSLYLSDKNKANPVKKNITDSLQTSKNPEINASRNTSNSKVPLDVKRNHKSNPVQKPITSNEELAAKIPETERIIVHLGSDSSDDECEPDSHSDKKSNAVPSTESTEVNPVVSADNPDAIKEFEKSVELLLKGARRQIEKRTVLTPEVPSTPEAVYSHLAPSQRLEYMRLKQKIAEKEKLGKTEKNSVNISPPQEKSKSKPTTIQDKGINQINIQKNIGKRPMVCQNVKENNKTLTIKNGLTPKEIRNPSDKNHLMQTPDYGIIGNKNARVNPFSTIRKPVPELNLQKGLGIALKKDLPDLNSNNPIEQGPAEIIIERKKMLNQNRLHLERLKILWKNIKIEKMIEAKYEREIKKLKVQQNFFELKITQQRLKIKRLADQSQEIYDAFRRNNKTVEVCTKKRKSVTNTEDQEKKVKVSDNVTADDVPADKEDGKDVTKELVPDSVENDVRLIAKDTDIGVNEKREDVKADTKENVEDEKKPVEEKVENEKKPDEEKVENEKKPDEEKVENEKKPDEDKVGREKKPDEDKVGNEKKPDEKEAATLNDKDYLKEYNSPLQALRKSSQSVDCPRVDPNVIMCQYDLLGKCNDEECAFQHWPA